MCYVLFHVYVLLAFNVMTKQKARYDVLWHISSILRSCQQKKKRFNFKMISSVILCYSCHKILNYIQVVGQNYNSKQPNPIHKIRRESSPVIDHANLNFSEWFDLQAFLIFPLHVTIVLSSTTLLRIGGFMGVFFAHVQANRIKTLPFLLRQELPQLSL